MRDWRPLSPHSVSSPPRGQAAALPGSRTLPSRPPEHSSLCNRPGASLPPGRPRSEPAEARSSLPGPASQGLEGCERGQATFLGPGRGASRFLELCPLQHVRDGGLRPAGAPQPASARPEEAAAVARPVLAVDGGVELKHLRCPGAEPSVEPACLGRAHSRGRAWGTVQASVASDLGVRSAVWWTCSLPLLDALESGEMRRAAEQEVRGAEGPPTPRREGELGPEATRLAPSGAVTPVPYSLLDAYSPSRACGMRRHACHPRPPP